MTLKWISDIDEEDDEDWWNRDNKKTGGPSFSSLSSDYLSNVDSNAYDTPISHFHQKSFPWPVAWDWSWKCIICWMNAIRRFMSVYWLAIDCSLIHAEMTRNSWEALSVKIIIWSDKDKDCFMKNSDSIEIVLFMRCNHSSQILLIGFFLFQDNNLWVCQGERIYWAILS